jgi:citronellol/citronellal dehydrogenase
MGMGTGTVMATGTATLAGKTIFITGASRGIGRAIALRAARDGANVVITAKTIEPHPKLPGTIHTVADEVTAAGGNALAIQLDVRDAENIQGAVARAAEHFGGIDICINNASAISLTPTGDTPPKRFDLMFDCNVRGTYLVSQACLPHLLASAGSGRNPHILNLSPPLSMKPGWFAPHVAYTMSKYGMSMCTLGMAAEFREAGIAVNSLWPRTTVATAAVEFNFPQEILNASRTPAIMADAAHAILTMDSRSKTGNFFLDESVLRLGGVTDFEHYAVRPGTPLFTDLFVDP